MRNTGICLYKKNVFLYDDFNLLVRNILQDRCLMITTSSRQLALANVHRRLNAKMVPFAGWEMPVQYEGIIAEYWATRREVAVYDTSHMGEFIVEGSAGTEGLDRLVTQSILDMPFSSCRYGLLLNALGGVMDDLIVYRLAKEKWMVVVNAGTMEKDAQQFERVLGGASAFRNISAELGKIDVQGPLSRDVLKSLVTGLEKLEYYTFLETVLFNERCLISRTGYTGELGFEIYFPWNKMVKLWDELMSLGIKPAGLGARDVLRIEVGYPLYGHELSEEVSPLPAGLSRFIDFNKEFVGKDALLREKTAGLKRKLIGFVSDSRRSPRAGQQVFSSAQTPMGQVTSGTFSPARQKGIGLAMVDIAGGVESQQIFFGEGEPSVPAQVVGRPIYKNGSLKK